MCKRYVTKLYLIPTHYDFRESDDFLNLKENRDL